MTGRCCRGAVSPEDSVADCPPATIETLRIDWCAFESERFPYRCSTPGEHYRLIVAAMRANADQNPEVKPIVLATGDLILNPTTTAKRSIQRLSGNTTTSASPARN